MQLLFPDSLPDSIGTMELTVGNTFTGILGYVTSPALTFWSFSTNVGKQKEWYYFKLTIDISGNEETDVKAGGFSEGLQTN